MIVAIDGQPCDPHEPVDGRLILGPAMRLDVVVDMQGDPGRRYQVIDDFYDGFSYWLTEVAYDKGPPTRQNPLDCCDCPAEESVARTRSGAAENA